MKTKALLAVITLFLASAPLARSAGGDPDGAGWLLINEDPEGNLLYVDSATMERSSDGMVRVWMKFVSRAGNSPSPMLFLNEIDCSKGLIKRLEVRIHGSAGAETGEPFRRLSFDGTWDRPSEGLEEHVREAVCRDGGGVGP